MVKAPVKAESFANGSVSVSSALAEKNPSEKNKVTQAQNLDSESNTSRDEIRSISGQKIITVGEEGSKLLENNLMKMKAKGLKGVALAGGLASAAAFVFEFLPDSGLKTFVENNIKRVVAGVFGAFGSIGAVDSINRNDYKQTVAQLASIAIPNFLVPKDQFEDLTLYRGFDVGAMNFAAEADKLPGGKKNYGSGGESLGHIFTAVETLFRDLKNDPIKAVSDFKSGVGTLFWSSLTMLSPVVYKVTGARFPSYLMRHAGGLVSEFGKLNPANLAKGAYKYFASGLFLFSSSLINLVGAGAGERTKKLSEYITWALNIFGKELQLAAISSGETSKDFKAKAINVSDLPGLIISHFTGKNGYQASVDTNGNALKKEELAEQNIEENTPQETTVYLGKSNTISSPRTSAFTRSYFRPMSRGSSSGGSGVSRSPASKSKPSSPTKSAPAKTSSKGKAKSSSQGTKSSSSPRKVGGRFSSSKK